MFPFPFTLERSISIHLDFFRWVTFFLLEGTVCNCALSFLFFRIALKHFSFRISSYWFHKLSVWVHQILLLWMPVGKPDFFLFLTVRRDRYQWIQGNTSTIAQYKVWPLQPQFRSEGKSSIIPTHLLFLKISLAFFDPWGRKYNPPYYVKIGVGEAYTSSCGLSSKARGWNRLSAFWSSCFRVDHTSLTFLAFTHFSLPLSLALPVHPSWEASPVFCRNFSASLFSLYHLLLQ